MTTATKPCIKCGSDDRKPSGDCRPCAKARDKSYKASRREKLAEQSRLYYASHKDQVRITAKNWREKNKELKKMKDSEYRKANPEKVAAYKRKHYIANTEKIKKRASEWVKANAEYVKERQSKYFKANPEISVNSKAKRRSLIGNDRLPYGTIPAKFKEQGGLCVCCGQPLVKYHVDHIMPLALGGKNIPENIQLLLPKCNRQKYAKHPDVWKAEKGLNQNPQISSSTS